MRAELAVNEGDCAGDTLLHRASREGTESAVRFLLEAEDANPGITNNAGETPLHLACSRGHAGIVRMLVDAGSPVSRPSRAGDTPLSLAVRCGSAECADLLVARGATPSVPRPPSTVVTTTAQSLLSSVISACDMGDSDAVRRLLCRDKSPRLVDLPERETSTARFPVGVACQKGDVAMLNLLIELGSPPHSALELLTLSSNEEVAVEIATHVAFGDVPWRDAVLGKLLWVVVGGTSPHITILELVLQAGARVPRKSLRPLTAACLSQDLTAARLLAFIGADPNEDLCGTCGPLHVSVIRGDPELVRMLVANGADLRAFDDAKRTAITIACERWDALSGASLNIAEFLFDSSLGQFAGVYPRLNSASAGATEMALVYGAYSCQELESQQVLTCAADAGDMAKLSMLLCAGYDPVAVPTLHRALNEELATFLLWLNPYDSYWHGVKSELSPLCCACERSRPAVVEAILANCDGTNVDDQEGTSPLHVAAARGDERSVKALLIAGANVNRRNRIGNTVLGIAMWQCRWEAAGVLIKWGACIVPDLLHLSRLTPRNFWSSAIECGAFCGAPPKVNECAPFFARNAEDTCNPTDTMFLEQPGHDTLEALERVTYIV